MAVVSPTTSPERSFSMAKLISRLRRRSKHVPGQQDEQLSALDTRPPLVTSPLPLVLPEHQKTLSTLGWTTITFPQSPPISGSVIDQPTPASHPLQSAYEALLLASQAFFAQSAEEKQHWKHKLGSEEGWSCIPGEKEFITLRTLEYCPDILRKPAKRYWGLMGSHLESTLGRIATSLALPDPASEKGGLRRFVGPCGKMPDLDGQKTATMLRLFRYEGWDAKEVAEPHADLGLLSVVVGNVPGLEVWDGANWFEIEKEVEKTGLRGASLLAGRQLEWLSNGRYPAGGHRVVSYGSPRGCKEHKTRYRFSIVFVLRAHEPVTIRSTDMETGVTGKWAEPVHSLTAGELYAIIQGAHFNINISKEERKQQRENVQRAKVQVKAKDTSKLQI